MKKLLLFVSLFAFSCSQLPDEDVFDGPLYCNLYKTDIFLPSALRPGRITHTLSDSLFTGYETLKNMVPDNELHGDLFDFIYYNFDLIDERYYYKRIFSNPKPEGYPFNPPEPGRPQPISDDSVIFLLGDRPYTTWDSTFIGPYWVMDTLYNNYEEFLERQKLFFRIYDLGNIVVRKEFDSRLILIDKKMKEEVRRYLYLFNTVDNRVKSVLQISKYEESEAYGIIYFNSKMVEEGIFKAGHGVPPYYVEEQRKEGHLIHRHPSFKYYIDKKGYAGYIEEEEEESEDDSWFY
jgi:hypothetical protein